MTEAVLLGPYVGDFTHEILTFRPYIRYITQITEPNVDIFISSHSNRSFLYDWISEDRFFPIFEHITRNELSQKGFIYQDITKTEFNQITKSIKNQINSDTIDVYNLPYIKSTNSISIYQKVFRPFKVPSIEVPESDIIFIADQSDNAREVFEKISKTFNVIVIGNMNNGLEEYNILLKEPIIDNNYLKMFNMIQKTKMVVTNCHEWAFICNLQKLPVLYWGNEFSLYKSSGILNFGNDKCMSLCDMEPDSIVDMIKYNYKKLYR